jgi:hypothetical protein
LYRIRLSAAEVEIAFGPDTTLWTAQCRAVATAFKVTPAAKEGGAAARPVASV